MLPFHRLGEELKCVWRLGVYFPLAQWGQQGRLPPQQEGQPGSSSDTPCALEQVLSVTISAHSRAEF